MHLSIGPDDRIHYVDHGGKPPQQWLDVSIAGFTIHFQHAETAAVFARAILDRMGLAALPKKARLDVALGLDAPGSPFAGFLDPLALPPERPPAPDFLIGRAELQAPVDAAPIEPGQYWRYVGSDPRWAGTGDMLVVEVRRGSRFPQVVTSRRGIFELWLETYFRQHFAPSVPRPDQPITRAAP